MRSATGSERVQKIISAGFLAASCTSTAPRKSVAAEPSGYQTVDGFGVYPGVLPAEMLRDRAKAGPEATMRGGVPGRNMRTTWSLPCSTREPASGSRTPTCRPRWRRSGQATGTYAHGRRAYIRELLRDANQTRYPVDWSCLRRCALAIKLIQINARRVSR
jgi:hypothetical protein